MAQAAHQRGLLADASDELAAAVERAGRSVVSVDARDRGPASGVLWDSQGTIVTAAHVIERSSRLSVAFGGTTVGAVLVARDGGSDLAVLRAPASGATPAELAPSDATAVGHLVLAVGRPESAAPMASFGVVSALGTGGRTREGGIVPSYVRTDAALLPGCSGGPLVDVQGRVVGIASSSFGTAGAVAMASAAVARLVDELRSGEPVRRGYLGVSTLIVELQAAVRERLGLAEERGLMLVSVETDSPAEQAGLLVGDILLALGERGLTDGEALQMALGPGAVGRRTALRVMRAGALRDVVVVPAERPRGYGGHAGPAR